MEAMGVPEKSPEDTHVSGTASMAKKLEGKPPSHHKDQSVDDSEKGEESQKTPDSPSKAKVANVFHSTPGDQRKKEPQKMSEPNSKVTKLASAINADPDTFRTKKKTKEETKSKNTGSVMSMIKKIQKTSNKKKENAQPTGKVKISPKFDVNGNGKEDHVFTFKPTDESVPGKTEKMIASSRKEQQNEKKTRDAIDDPDERDMTYKGFRDEVAAKLKRLSLGDEDKDVLDTDTKAETKSEASDFKLKEPVSVNGQSDDKDSNDNYTKLAVDKNSKGNDAMELGNGLEKNIMGNAVSGIAVLENTSSPQHTGKTDKSQDQTKSSLKTAVSVRETMDDFQSDFAEKIVTPRAKEISKSTTTDRKTNGNSAKSTENRRERKSNKDNPDRRDCDRINASVARNGHTEDRISDEGSVTKKNVGLSENNSLTLGDDDVTTEKGSDITTTTDELGKYKEITDSHSKTEDFGSDEVGTNFERIPSFTKHELFFTSAKVDDSPDDGEDETNVENSKKNTSVLSDIQDTHDIDGIPEHNGANASLSDTNADISIKRDDTIMKLVEDSTFENVWSIVEGKSDKLISDAESDNISNFNKSLSASTASLDSNLSLDVKKLKDEQFVKAEGSKTRKKSSGNKMSKPECMQRNTRGQSLEHLDEIILENKENFNTKSQPRKTIDIRIFEALKVYLL